MRFVMRFLAVQLLWCESHTCRVTPGRYILSVPTLYLAFGTAPGSAGCSSCNICIATTNHSECRALFLSA
ncbi:unnamed protein product [Ectocarpus sp. 8 AP-2014]